MIDYVVISVALPLHDFAGIPSNASTVQRRTTILQEIEGFRGARGGSPSRVSSSHEVDGACHAVHEQQCRDRVLLVHSKHEQFHMMTPRIDIEHS